MGEKAPGPGGRAQRCRNRPQTDRPCTSSLKMHSPYPAATSFAAALFIALSNPKVEPSRARRPPVKTPIACFLMSANAEPPVS